MEALFFNPGLANSSGLIDSEVLLIVVTAAVTPSPMRQVDRRTAGVVGAAIRDPGTVFSPSLAGRMFNHRCGSSILVYY